MTPKATPDRDGVERVRVPADLDRPDPILLGLSARHLAILGGCGLLAWTLAVVADPLLGSKLAAAVVAAPAVLAGVGLAVGWRDGLSLDRLAVAGLRWWSQPRRRVVAPNGPATAPGWAGPPGPRLAALTGPISGLHPDGVLELAGAGWARVCAASPVNLRLRTPAEQQQLLASFARFLHALQGPIQVEVRSQPADLGALANRVRAKLSGPCWEVRVRYGVSDPAGLRGRLRSRAHALAAAYAVYSGPNRLGRRRLWHPIRTLATRPLHRSDLLAVGELAALAHLPLDPAVPGLARAGARPVPAPPGLPDHGKPLGDPELGPARPVRLTPADACHHVHLLGATGSGKSTLIANLALHDITEGRGVVVIDPKGDLVGDLLQRLPDHAVQRLVLLDPDERAAPPTLNPLEGDDPDLAVDHLVGILHRIWIAHWGPRIDDVLRASCLTLLRRPGATLTDIPRLLSDPVFRHPYLQGLDDPVGLGGFWAWYQAQSPATQAQMVGPIMTRLRAFLLRSFVRDVVGSARSSFDMAQVLDGGVLFARLPKGLLGDDTARLLGSFVVARVWQAATARARQGQRLRHPASLYVDECQNFLTLPYRFEELLPEARGYGLALHLAHQHLGQLPRELHDALSANARTKVYFTVSPEDARALERHVHPQLSAYDLSHLGAWQAAVRLVAGGSELPACTIRTRPAPPAIPGRAEAARAAARARYGRTSSQRRAETLQREYGAGDDPRLRDPSAPPTTGDPPAAATPGGHGRGSPAPP